MNLPKTEKGGREEKSVVRSSLRQLEGYEVENDRDQELLNPLRDRALVPAVGNSPPTPWVWRPSFVAWPPWAPLACQPRTRARETLVADAAS